MATEVDTVIIDSADLDSGTTLTADVCVIGGGAAGLAIAYKLRNSRISTIVLESGYRSEDTATRRRITGRNAGGDGFEIGGQRRRLGGGTNDWSGNCSLLEPDDFDAQGNTAWPIGFAELAEQESAVSEFLGLSARFGLDALAQTSEARPFRLGKEEGTLTEKTYIRNGVSLQVEHEQTILGGRGDVRIVLGATVASVVMNQSGREATEAVAYDDAGRRIRVTASVFVVSSGVENAPILLRSLAHQRLPALGRYLHSHLLSVRGFFVPAGPPDPFMAYSLPDDLGETVSARVREFHGIRIDPTLRRKKEMLNGSIFLAPLHEGSQLLPPEVLATAEKTPGLGSLEADNMFAVRHFLEQEPSWDSRVELGRLREDIPVRRAQYRWKVGPIEEATIDAGLEALAQGMRTRELGEVLAVSCGEELNSDILTRNAHPMGGTIMGSSPTGSVVDANCQVHGIANLFVCGGSVIPRGGAAMVTGVILQLAFRLAAHLETRMGR